MGQQTNDSKFSEYGLASIETGFPNHDKNMSMSVATKKKALRDIQNDNTVAECKCLGKAVLLKESEPSSEAAKVSGGKRSMPESFPSSPHQSLTSNAVNGHLVYVRRKIEADLGKNGVIENKSSKADCPQLSKVSNQDEKAQKKVQTEDSKVCEPDIQHSPTASPERFSSEKPSVSASLGMSNNILLLADSNQLRVTSANSLVDYPSRIDIQQWEERYTRLQNLLKKMEQSNQNDYVQMLRSLSSVDLSRHAVELEKRSIQLSLEEAKEMQRVCLLDVLRKYPKNY